jgi:tRNA pseudouridine38-40 synthase
VEYDGTSYSGWQRQPQVPTVLGELEKALVRVSGHAVKVFAAGRTDAGVHALGQVCNFKIATRLTPPEIVRIVNQLLPGDIRIVKACWVPDAFHSTYHAASKIYRYVIRTVSEKSVFDRLYHHPLKRARPLDLVAMRRAASKLKGTHDFRSFQGQTIYKRDPMRRILSVKVLRNGPEVHLEFHGKSFLYQMVRILAGTLVYVGLGKIKPEEIPSILAAKDRRRAGPTLPPGGLFLVKVFYPKDAGKHRKVEESEEGVE